MGEKEEISFCSGVHLNIDHEAFLAITRPIKLLSSTLLEMTHVLPAKLLDEPFNSFNCNVVVVLPSEDKG